MMGGTLVKMSISGDSIVVAVRHQVSCDLAGEAAGLAGEAAGSKLEKAKALGVPTVTWGEMLEILEGGS